ncbi:hypothetical protein CVT26_009961 [Gymnopilus dilepis]|uniref:Uncharacterized protein n=1 Tax=Gymnopilus dilepis TaxID=231916 RepID=A0A409VL55_9AGAR|nr:hypothetical protein CVT26_009961 [Gymnopilus dilepis]
MEPQPDGVGGRQRDQKWQKLSLNEQASLSRIEVLLQILPPPATPMREDIHATCALAAHASSSTSSAGTALDDGLGFTLLRWEMLCVVVPSIPPSDGGVLLVEHELDYRPFRLFAYCWLAGLNHVVL